MIPDALTIMVNFKRVMAGVSQTEKNPEVLGLLRSRWHIVTATASVLCLLFIPFEKLASDSATHLHITFAAVPLAIGAWRLALRRKIHSQEPTGDHVKIRYACGHSSKIGREQVARWAGGNINFNQLDLHVPCKRCSTVKPANKKRVSPRLAGSAIAGMVVLAIVAYGLTSGIASSIIRQAATLSGSVSGIQNVASYGGASDLLSGKGSVEDLTSLKDAVPGGDQLELADIEAYSFADGYVTIGETRFALEVAGTNEEKSRGLSFSEGLKGDQAFLIQKPKSTTITLLSASFTVDVLWLADNKVVDIAQGVTECKVTSLDSIMESSGSGCVYKPSVLANAVLYLDSGTVKDAGIEKGTVLELTINS